MAAFLERANTILHYNYYNLHRLKVYLKQDKEQQWRNFSNGEILRDVEETKRKYGR